jgi:hypothetical protein
MEQFSEISIFSNEKNEIALEKQCFSNEISLSENVELAIIEDLIRQLKPFTNDD